MVLDARRKSSSPGLMNWISEGLSESSAASCLATTAEVPSSGQSLVDSVLIPSLARPGTRTSHNSLMLARSTKERCTTNSSISNHQAMSHVHGTGPGDDGEDGEEGCMF
mmetsp:Transcript_16281/g.28441  ORF Transcript_16281/g.28441 Transcript_16281/m.28441 type:complete len:109 (-) Transcript_16281:1010-1336(-)